MGSAVVLISFYVFFTITLINNLMQHEGEVQDNHNSALCYKQNVKNLYLWAIPSVHTESFS